MSVMTYRREAISKHEDLKAILGKLAKMSCIWYFKLTKTHCRMFIARGFFDILMVYQQVITQLLACRKIDGCLDLIQRQCACVYFAQPYCIDNGFLMVLGLYIPFS